MARGCEAETKPGIPCTRPATRRVLLEYIADDLCAEHAQARIAAGTADVMYDLNNIIPAIPLYRRQGYGPRA